MSGEQATWGTTACHWLPPRTRARLIRSLISSQRLSGIEVERAAAERALLKVLHEPLVELG